MSKKSTVYLLGDSLKEGLFKIGVTRGTVENRLKKLQTGNAGQLYIVDKYETDYPFFIEKRMHLKYHSLNEMNEWFNMESSDVVQFKSECRSIEESIDGMKENEFFMKNLCE